MTFEYNNTKINYEIFGTGNELFVFFHGWGANLDLFKPFSNLFQNKICLLIDFPPFGKSDEPKQVWSLDNYVELSSQIIDKVIFENNCELNAIFAHSFGGRVAIKGISTKAFRPKLLILFGSAGIKPKFSLKTKLNIIKYKFYKKFGINKTKNFGSKDYVVLSPTMKKTFSNIVCENLEKHCNNITAKTLIIFGEKDKETPLYMGKKLNKLIKNSKFYTIKNAGHFAYLEQLKTVYSIVYMFLKLNT